MNTAVADWPKLMRNYAAGSLTSAGASRSTLPDHSPSSEANTRRRVVLGIRQSTENLMKGLCLVRSCHEEADAGRPSECWQRERKPDEAARPGLLLLPPSASFSPRQVIRGIAMLYAPRLRVRGEPSRNAASLRRNRSSASFRSPQRRRH